MTLWKFLINGTEIEEPIGWDAVTITIIRDKDYQGMENVFSDSIKFWGTGAEIIRDAFQSYGVEAVLSFQISYSCDQGATYTHLFSGILNCLFYSCINSEVTIKIEPSGFHRTVKNRLTVPVNLNSNTSIDGLPMSSISPFDLGLHSKEIVQVSELNAPTELTFSDDSVDQTDILGGISVPMIWEEAVTELSTISGFVNFYWSGPINADAPSTLFTAGQTGLYKFNYDIRGGFFELYNASRTFNVRLSYRINSTGTTIHDYGGQTGAPDVSVLVELNEQGTLDLNLNAGDKVSFYIALTGYSGSTTSQKHTITLILNQGTFLKVSKAVALDPSSTKALLLHEAFAKISESITGVQDCFRSNFFGRINSAPHTYAVDGCGAWTAITNGLNIRRMLDKNGSLFPIVTTFQDLFQSCDAVWNLGMRIEKDSTGKEFIRVEPKEYFYNASAVLNLFNISDLNEAPAQDLLFNTYKVGYEKWNLNITGSNAIDEFNSDRNYVLPGKIINKNLPTISKYIASGYVIEETRRLQYKENPSNDFETDNDMFFICTNRAEVTSSLYTVPATSTVYASGTVSERDENFSSVLKVLNASTSYNLRISPARMALNWYKYLAATIYKAPAASIKFTSGSGNYQETDTMINDCIVSATVAQNEDLTATELIGSNGSVLYLPEYLKFTYPLSYDEFLLILANSEKAIGVSCSSDSMYIGYIDSIKYSPTVNGGIADFQLIRGSVIQGDFNNDFNNDFSRGNY
jgi:hypothetical protein